jgi:type II secretory pathway pseudopilin PulG
MGRKNFKHNFSKIFLKNYNGVTFIELLIVLSILGALIIVTVLALKPKFQIAKARDSERESDLKRISIALDEYIDDNPCYPDSLYDGSLDPYLPNGVPKDPVTHQNFDYQKVECKKFVIYSTLETKNSSLFYNYNNSPYSGNYIVTSSNFIFGPTIVESVNQPRTTPTPYCVHFRFGCLGSQCLPIVRGDCNCQTYFLNDTCDGMCTPCVGGDYCHDFSCPANLDQ